MNKFLAGVFCALLAVLPSSAHAKDSPACVAAKQASDAAYAAYNQVHQNCKSKAVSKDGKIEYYRDLSTEKSQACWAASDLSDKSVGVAKQVCGHY